MARLLILDRDGVINHDSPDYIRTPAEWQPIAGSLEAIARASAAGWSVAVATNQSAVGRGLIDDADLEDINNAMIEAVEAAGGMIDLLVWCPHHPDDDCDCRKPKPGLLHRIADELGMPLDQAVLIGDSCRDLEAASAAGVTAWLVRSGNGVKSESRCGNLAGAVFDDLAAAIDHLVKS